MKLAIAIFTATAMSAAPLPINPNATIRDGLTAQWNHDYPTAIAIFSKLADDNNPAAMTFLGAVYAAGIGVPKDAVKAEKLYLAAAKMNYPPAETAIGVTLEPGRGPHADIVTAISWLQKSATQGMPQASIISLLPMIPVWASKWIEQKQLSLCALQLYRGFPRLRST
jgi:TPR repeat protein